MFCQLFNSSHNLKDKNFTIFFNHITNWGTYNEEEYKEKDISRTDHPNHDEFIEMLRIVDKQPNVLHNFNHLLENVITPKSII